MILLPAIDLYGGKAVRLLRGDYDKMTVYSQDPVSVAEAFAREGAEWVHLVDLEGARDGTTANFDTIRRILSASGLRAEVGGGIRSLAAAERYCAMGAERVILGTAAVTDPAFLKEAVRTFGQKVAVGVDVRDGYAAIRGWKERSPLTAEALFARLEEEGVETVIVTDVSRDGAMKGVNEALYRRLAERLSMKVVASGGVFCAEDILRLREMGLYGAIVGKAWYEGKLDLKEAIGAAL